METKNSTLLVESEILINEDSNIKADITNKYIELLLLLAPEVERNENYYKKDLKSYLQNPKINYKWKIYQFCLSTILIFSLCYSIIPLIQGLSQNLNLYSFNFILNVFCFIISSFLSYNTLHYIMYNPLHAVWDFHTRSHNSLLSQYEDKFDFLTNPIFKSKPDTAGVSLYEIFKIICKHGIKNKAVIHQEIRKKYQYELHKNICQHPHIPDYLLLGELDNYVRYMRARKILKNQGVDSKDIEQYLPKAIFNKESFVNLKSVDVVQNLINTIVQFNPQLNNCKVLENTINQMPLDVINSLQSKLDYLQKLKKYSPEYKIQLLNSIDDEMTISDITNELKQGINSHLENVLRTMVKNSLTL